ncbi:MAG TPA: GAF domain-containing protein, partial [Blastocatellia bacterium]|nr:GAF domain-containing protein [Blastocatellia bacterium]
KSREDVARHIATIFRENLSMPLLAIYCGKAGDETLMNVLPLDWDQQAELIQARLPESISSASLQAFPRPQVTIAAELTGRGYQEPAGESPDLVAVLPWRGAFFWGGIIVGQPPQPFNPDMFTPISGAISALGDRLGVALEIEKEQAESRGQQELARKAFNFARSIMALSDGPAAYAVMAREVASLVGADSAAIWRVDPAGSMVRMAGSFGLRNEDLLPLPVGQGLAGTIAETRQPLSLQDAPSDPRCLFPREARENGIVSYLGAPISLEEKTLGVVEVHSAQARAWREADEAALQSAAQLIAVSLGSAEAESDRLKVESAYLGLSEALQRLRSRDELLEAAVEVLGHALSVSRALALELDESGKTAPVRIEYLSPGVASCSGRVFDEAFVSKASNAVSGGEVFETPDSSQESLLGEQEAASLKILSEMLVPVRIDDRPVGFIYLHQCDRARQWQADEVGFASRVGRQLSLSLTGLQSLERMSSEAEAAREQAGRAKEEIARAHSLVASLPEAVIGLDQEGRLTFFNAAARDWLGLSDDDVGRMAEMTEALTVTDDSLWGNVISCKTPARFQTSLVRLTGAGPEDVPGTPTQGATPVPVSISIAPLTSEGGETGGCVVVISDVGHIVSDSEKYAARIAELERGMNDLAQSLSAARTTETELRAALDRLRVAEAEARASVESLRRQDAELRKEFDHLREEESALRKSAQQLLEINRLKSEFIVNAGRELEATLLSVLGFAELLEQGTYGPLTGDQLKAVRSMYSNAKRMRQDVEWLVEYGSTRSRRLDTGAEETTQKP